MPPKVLLVNPEQLLEEGVQLTIGKVLLHCSGETNG
jgi:hypothetical protein